MTQTATGAEDLQTDDVLLTGTPEEPEFHEVSDEAYAFMVQKQNDLLMFGWAIQNVKINFYQGTVPARVKRRRRTAGKLARAARRLARPKKRARSGVRRTKHTH